MLWCLCDFSFSVRSARNVIISSCHIFIKTCVWYEYVIIVIHAFSIVYKLFFLVCSTPFKRFRYGSRLIYRISVTHSSQAVKYERPRARAHKRAIKIRAQMQLVKAIGLCKQKKHDRLLSTRLPPVFFFSVEHLKGVFCSLARVRYIH